MAKKIKSSDSIFNKINDDQFNRMCIENGWEPLPTYKDYYEPSQEQLALQELEQSLKDFYKELKSESPEFAKTFKKKFKDILE